MTDDSEVIILYIHTFQDFDIEESMSTTSQRSVLDIYLDDIKLDRNVDLNILNFWKVNEGKYGELAYLARDVLSVPLTTVASESTFSIGGRILNKWRSSYLPDNIEALITSRSWLHGYDRKYTSNILLFVFSNFFNI